MEIGPIIRKRRLALGLKQAVFAEMAGLNAAADVSRIETGKWWPSEAKFQAIAHALKCKVSDLFSEAEGFNKNYSFQDDVIAPKAKESVLPSYLSNEDVLNYVLSLHKTVVETHASQSKTMQIIFYSMAKQLDGAKLLTELKQARDRVAIENAPNQLLDEMLNHLIGQIMRSAGDTN